MEHTLPAISKSQDGSKKYLEDGDLILLLNIIHALVLYLSDFEHAGMLSETMLISFSQQ
jgi:hypothetical protein